MKTSVNKAILYDDHCPMCAAYTLGFVHWGVLPTENRIAFTQAGQHLPAEVLTTQLDPQRARHEIPLVDLNGGPTLYGVDAMAYLLSQRLPIIGRLLRYAPVHGFFTWLYRLVSYNRRVIIPTTTAPTAFDCAPDFHLGYRLAFVAYALTVAALVTYAFGWSTEHYWPTTHAGAKMLLVCGTGWAFTIVRALLFLPRHQRIDYVGHLAVLMILGVGILVPGMGLSWATGYQYPLIPLLSVAASSSVMTWQHVLRTKHLGLSQRWTLAWLASLLSTAVGWLYAFGWY